MPVPSKTLAPNAVLVDPKTGLGTRALNNYLNNLTANANAAAAGTITTAPGSGLFGGGNVADGISIGIAANGVTNAMIRQSAGYSVIGRFAGTAGDVADITATADDRVLARIGGVLAFWDLALVPSVVADGDYGDITVSGVGAVWTIDNNVVSNAKLAQVPTATFKGRTTAGTGNAEDLTATQATALLNAFSTSLKGLAPASGGGTANYLRADGTWAAPPGTTGTVTSVSVVTANGFSGTVATATTTPAITLSYAAAALTRTNDTNVTLTLGGSPTIALLAATSLTLGWTGQLAASRGGTGVSALGDITRTNDTNVTLTLGGTPTGAVITSTSFTLGWTGRLAYARFIAATQKSLVGATAAGDFGEITLGTGVAITAGVLSATGTGGTVTSVSVVTANGFSGSVATSTTTPAITLSYAGAALTKADDTNVTLTLGGTPTTALLQAVSVTAGWTGTLAATRGGTGLGSYAVGDILYASTTTALSALADVATGNALISGGVTTAPAWGKIGLTTHISGTLAVANGGTGVTTSTGTGNVVLSASPTFTGTIAAGNISGGTITANTSSSGDGVISDGTTNPSFVLKISGTTKCFYGAVTATNGIIVGSAVNDIAFRSNGGNILFSVNSGGSAVAVLSGTGAAVTGAVSASTYLKSTAKTVAALTAAATAGAGARDCVTDAVAPTFGAAVVGGGAITTPVFCTGAAWNVG